MDDTGPFDRMDEGFRLFAAQGRRWGRGFISLSAGVNWTQPNPAVIDLLDYELRQSMTSRNYGAVGGLPPVVRLLEFVERTLSGQHDLRVTVTHGTTEGAYLTMHHCSSARPQPGERRALMIGHGFPLYERLCGDFGWQFFECLAHPDEPDGFMPTLEQIAEALDQHRPALVFLILPNNPLGQIVTPESLTLIRDYVRDNAAFLLVDRVCLMPWDERSTLLPMIGDLIASGNAIAVDSFSKSESLAGFRTGYVITNDDIRATMLPHVRSRFLNPVTFATATLAATRLAETAVRAGRQAIGIFRRAHDEIFSEYPLDEDFSLFLDKAESLFPDYERHLQARRARIDRNFRSLCDCMEGLVIRPLLLEGGFNVAVAAGSMQRQHEVRDQVALATDHGLGILTTRCFCRQDPSRGYFVRVGLSLSPDDFDIGVHRLTKYLADQ